MQGLWRLGSDMHEAENFYANINENLEEGTIANMYRPYTIDLSKAVYIYTQVCTHTYSSFKLVLSYTPSPPLFFCFSCKCLNCYVYYRML